MQKVLLLDLQNFNEWLRAYEISRSVIKIVINFLNGYIDIRE